MLQEENDQGNNDEPEPATPDIIEKGKDSNQKKGEPPIAKQDSMLFDMLHIEKKEEEKEEDNSD